MENQDDILEMDLQIDSISKSYLLETAKWAKFISFLGFAISTVIAIIAVYYRYTYGSGLKGYRNVGFATIGTISFTILYLVIAIVNIILSYYLLSFANEMSSAINTLDQYLLSKSLKNQRNMYRMIGILTGVYFGFILLAFLYSFFSSSLR